MFPALESYGSAVHPMLVDEMRDFQGALDSQIRDVNAYYMHKQEEARLEEQRRYGAAQQPQGSYPTPPDYQSPPQPFEPVQSFHDPHGYTNAEAAGVHQQPPQQQWYQAPVQAHGQHDYEQSTAQYPMRGSQLVPVDPHHAAMPQDHSQPYGMYPPDASHDTGQAHGQYQGVGAPSAGQGYYHGHEMPPPPPPASRSQLWHVPAGHVEGELMYPTTSVDYPPPPGQSMHPAAPVEYVPPPGPPPGHQAMHQTAPYGHAHAPTPSLSRSSSMTQMRPHAPMPPPQQQHHQQPMMMTTQYSLQETWNTFMQGQLPPPQQQQQQQQQQHHQQRYGGQ